MKYAAVAVALAGVALADNQWDPVVKATTTTWKDPKWTPTPKVVDPKTWTSTWDDPSKPKPKTWTSTWDDPAKPKPKTTEPAVWDPVKPKPSTSGKCTYVTEVPVTKCRVEGSDCWETKTKSTFIGDTCTWSDWVDPAKKKTTTWTDWKNAPAASTTKSAKCAYTTEAVVVKCAPDHKDKCWAEKVTSTVYADVCTWSTWVDPAKATTWTAWDPAKTPAVKTESWSTWDPIKTPVAATNTWAPVVVTSVVTPAWTGKDGWFGPAWPVATDGCAVNVVTSYGAPVWSPVAAAPATTWATVVVSPSPATTWVPVAVSPSPKVPVPNVPGKGPNPDKGNKWAMTYSPFDAQSKCKTKEVIEVDIKKLASLGFTSVRIYSTQCDSLKLIGDACKANNLKIILGVFINKDGIEAAKSQVADIKKWALWEIVELIVIGNEAVFQGFCTADELVTFVKYCKWEFSEAGYKGPCTTTEPLAQWVKDGAKWCEVVDVVSANLYAFFNPDCPAENAGVFIQEQIEILAKICVKKDTYVMESGWPSEGSCNGKACPGKDKQSIAIKKIQELNGPKVVFFSFEDEVWKAPGAFNVEQHWGCADVFQGQWDPSKVTKTTTTTTKPAAATWTAWQ